MKVHKELLWDYDINAISQDRKFKCFYIERALTHGGDKALQDIGLDEIRGCFPKLHLPSTVRAFWKWYLGQGGNSGDSNRTSTGTSPSAKRIQII